MLYLGVAGIVTFDDNLDVSLPKALRGVAEGGLWIRRGVLNEYVKQTSLLLERFNAPDQPFTAREQQIVDFLRQGFSNRQIATAFSISERTVKFHVSNILNKSQISNRRQLQTTRRP